MEIENPVKPEKEEEPRMIKLEVPEDKASLSCLSGGHFVASIPLRHVSRIIAMGVASDLTRQLHAMFNSADYIKHKAEAAMQAKALAEKNPGFFKGMMEKIEKAVAGT